MRKLLVVATLLFLSSFAYAQVSQVLTLLSAATTQAAGSTFNTQALPPLRTMQASGVTSAGAGAATVQFQGSNDAVAGTWEVLGTVVLTLGTTRTSGAFVSEAPWPYVRAEITAISGTDAAVTATVGVSQQ